MAPAFDPPTMKENSMKRLFALAILACFSTATLTACNTMAGAGKDVQKAGRRSNKRPRTARTRTAEPLVGCEERVRKDAWAGETRPFFLRRFRGAC